MFINKFMPLLQCKSQLIIYKRLKWESKSIKLFATLYNLLLEECRHYKSSNKVPPLSEEQIISTNAFRKSMGISTTEWLKYPVLLRFSGRKLEQKYSQLKEGGFTHVTPAILAIHRKIIHKQVKYLKAHEFIPNEANVAENFISYLHPLPSYSIISDLTDANVFEDIYRAIVTRYIRWRCKATEEDMQKYFRIHKTVTKSFECLRENFEIAESLGFSPQKILRCGYLLANNSKNTKRVLAEMPTLAGMDMHKAMKLYPKLVCVNYDRYNTIYRYLKENDIPDSIIQKSMNIFTLAPITIKTRLEEIRAIPELRVLLNNPNALNLIIHHNQARSRLSFLKELKLKCATTRVLATNHDSFNLHVKSGKDINNFNEIAVFMRKLFKSESDAIMTNLRKHPYYRHVPLVAIEETYDYLINQKFDKSDIINVIQLLLYSRPKITGVLEKVNNIAFARTEELSHSERLNLMLYFLEKEHHFTGNGIWEDN